jgi:hypothetical protein
MKRKMRNRQLLMIGVLAMISLFACRKSPTDWDTHWSAPLASGRITIEDILGTNHLAIDELGWYHLVIDTTIEDFGWDDLVKIEDTTITKSYAMPFTLDVPPGVSIINQFQNESFLNTGDAALRKLNLKSGKLKYKMLNYIQGQIKCTYELPTAFINGIPVQLEAVAYPGGPGSPYVMEGEIDLAGCQIDLSGTTGFGLNELRSHVIIQTDPNASNDAQVHAGDLVKVEMQLIDPVVSYAKGYFGSEERKFDRDISLLSGLKGGHCQFDDGYVQLAIDQFIGVDLLFQLDQCRYFGVNGEQTDLIHPIIGVNQSIARATETSFGIAPTHWEMEMSGSNSNVIACVETLPLKMNIKSKATFNPFGNINAYSDFINTDKIAAVNVVTDIPLKMAFEDVIMESKVPVDVNTETFKNGQVRVRLINAFPFAIDADLYAGDINSPTFMGHAQIASSEIEATTLAPIPVASDWQWTATASQLTEIKNKGYLTIRWKLNTPGYPNLVGFRPGYYMEAIAVGDAELHLTLGGE